MLIGRSGAARVFGNDQVEAQLPGVAGGRFHADIGGNSAQDNGVDAATAQLQLQIGAVKGAPLAFGDFDIAVAFAKRRRLRPPVFRQRVRPGLRVDGLF